MNPGVLPLGVLAFLAVSAFAHSELPSILESMDREVREHPDAYLERAERSWLRLQHGDAGNPSAEDIDTLLRHSEWKAQGMRLRGYRLFLLGRLDEAEKQVRENLAGAAVGPEQPRLLARIGLARKDTSAAIAAYERAWLDNGREDDFLEMLRLHRSRGEAPSAVLEKGLKTHPQSPSVAEAVFEAWWDRGRKARRGKCLDLSRQALHWWPSSVDWKLRHARALLESGRRPEAKAVLLHALDLLDADSRLSAEVATQKRKEIFDLMEASR